MTQYAEPASTITSGGWTYNGSSLHADTDCDGSPPTPEDTYFAKITGSDTGSGTYFEVKLESITDPGVDTGFTVYIRDRVTNSGGPGEKMDAYLYQGTTLIATLWTNHAPPDDTFATDSIALNSADVANITDFSDLRVRIDVDTLGASPEQEEVSMILLEAPDAGTDWPITADSSSTSTAEITVVKAFPVVLDSASASNTAEINAVKAFPISGDSSSASNTASITVAQGWAISASSTSASDTASLSVIKAFPVVLDSTSTSSASHDPDQEHALSLTSTSASDSASLSATKAIPISLDSTSASNTASLAASQDQAISLDSTSTSTASLSSSQEQAVSLSSSSASSSTLSATLDAATTAPSNITVITPRLVLPSHADGFAATEGESQYPELWRGLQFDFSPILGYTGNRYLDTSPGVPLIGQKSGTVNWKDSYVGPVVEFPSDGGSEYIYFPDDPKWRMAGAYNHTFCMLARLGSPTSDYNTIWRDGPWSGSFGTYLNAAGGMGSTLRNDGDPWTFSATGYSLSSIFGDGLFHWLIWWYDYFNGTANWYHFLDRQRSLIDDYAWGPLHSTKGWARDSGATLRLGGDGTVGMPMELAAFRVYDRALSRNEISLLIEDPLAQYRQKPALRTFAPPQKRFIAPRQVEPSYADGFARSAEESQVPELFPDCAFVPALGQTWPNVAPGRFELEDICQPGSPWFQASTTSCGWQLRDGVWSVEGTLYSAEPQPVVLKDTECYTILFWLYWNPGAAWETQLQIRNDIASWNPLIIRSGNPTTTVNLYGYDITNTIVLSINKTDVPVGSSWLGVLKFDYNGAGKADLYCTDGTITTDSGLGSSGWAPNNNGPFLNNKSGIHAILSWDRLLSDAQIRQVLGDPLLPFRLRPQPFSLPATVEAPPATTQTTVHIPRQAEPSFADGFATCEEESANPGLWRGLTNAWIPALGVTGISSLLDHGYNRDDGVIAGAMTASDWVPDIYGYALEFDGLDDEVELSNNLLNSFGLGSIFARVQHTTDNAEMIIAADSDGETTRFLRFYFSGTSNKLMLYGRSFTAGWHDQISTDNSFATGWYDVAVTSDGSTIKLFVNGVEESTTADVGSNNGNWFGDLDSDTYYYRIFGSDRVGGAIYYDGKLSSLLHYDRCLSGPEVSELHGNPLAPLRLRSQPLTFGAAAGATEHAISGSSTSTSTASLDASQEMPVTLDSSSTSTAEIAAIRTIPITLDSSSTSTATITADMEAPISGSSSSTSTAEISVIKAFPVSLSSTSTSTASLATNQEHALSLTSTSTSTASLAVIRECPVVLDSSSTSSAQIAAEKSGSFPVILDSTSTSTASLAVTQEHALSLDAPSSSTASLSVDQEHALSLTSTSSSTASLSVIKAYPVTLDSTSSSSASLAVNQENAISGSSSSTSTGQISVILGKPFVGDSSSTSTATITVTKVVGGTEYPIIGDSSSTSTASLAASQEHAISLDAPSTSSGSLDAGQEMPISLTSTSTSTSSLSAAQEHAISGSSSSSSTAEINATILATAIPITGSSTSSSSASITVIKEIPIIGDSTSSSTAEITVVSPVIGNSTSSTTAEISVDLEASISGSSSSASTATADLSQLHAIIAQAIAASSAMIDVLSSGDSGEVVETITATSITKEIIPTCTRNITA